MKKQHKPPSKKKKIGKNLSPRNKKACHTHQNCPPAKHHGDRNPEFHEGQQQDIA
jgi:hypothetical protein